VTSVTLPNIHSHITLPLPSANHLHFQWSFHPEIHLGGIWGFLKTGWSIQVKRTVRGSRSLRWRLPCHIRQNNLDTKPILSNRSISFRFCTANISRIHWNQVTNPSTTWYPEDVWWVWEYTAMKAAVSDWALHRAKARNRPKIPKSIFPQPSFVRVATEAGLPPLWASWFKVVNSLRAAATRYFTTYLLCKIKARESERFN
jgi:hypothetical protein